MDMVINSRTKFIITLFASLLVSGLLIWEYLHGGVVSHHLFRNAEMPKISNWWSLLSVPVMTWVLLSIIQKRHHISHEQVSVTKPEKFGFAGGFLFGIAMTILFYNLPDLTSYLLISTFVLALFVPIYRPEYLLGFILGTVFGFGGIIPVIFGLLLMAVYAIEYCLIRKAFLKILGKTRQHQ